MTTNLQKVLWTALPNGLAGSPPSQANGLNVSVFIAPQLQADPTITNPSLALFPDFVNWPTAVAKVKWAVKFGSGPTVKATPTLTGPTAPNPALWQALFPSSSYVRPYAFDDLSGQFIFSYPVQNVLSFVMGQYQQVGARVSGQTMPSIATPTASAGDLHAFLSSQLTIPENTLQSSMTRLEQQYASTHYIPNGAPNLRQDFQQARWFFFIPPNTPRPPLTLPTFDFHQAVSAVGEFPGILRRLGLVIDLLIPLPTGVTGPATVQIVPTWTPARVVTSTDMTPQTAYVLNTTRFAAQPQSGEIVNGMLNLADPTNNYSLVEVDVDSAMNKSVTLAYSLQQRQAKPSADTPTTSGMPTLKSAGLSLVRTGRAATMVQRFLRARTLYNAIQTPTPGVLYAEDLMRGAIPDVQDGASGKWYSLMRRIGTYKFPTAPSSLQTMTIHDEGNFSTTVYRKPGVGPELYLHEAMWNWENWSLAAPRPGAALDQDGQPVRQQNTPQTPFPIQTDFAAEPGSLLPLRFGKTYRMRARVMDLAGNSAPYTVTDSTTALPGPSSAPLPYRRYEAVEGPVVLLHDPITHTATVASSPGEAALRMVVRSDFDKTPDEYVAYLSALGAGGYLATSQRHIAPPRTSEEMAELLGMFDIPSPTDPSTVVPNGSLATYNGIIAGSGRFSSDTFPVDQLTLPYFPEVFSRGAFLTGVPGSTGPVTQAFTGTWPTLLPFRLQLVGIPETQAPAAPAFTPGPAGSNGVLVVQLPKGQMTTVNLSSYMTQSDLDKMALYHLILDYINANGISNPYFAGLQAAVIQGLHWMITPFRPLTLIHPVQRPLLQPDFSSTFQQVGFTGFRNAGLVRNRGETLVTFVEHMPISRNSTNKVDVTAAWTDPVDDPTQPAPATMSFSAHAFQVPVDPTNINNSPTLAITHQQHFADTKYHAVTYQATASSRFRDYFPEAAIDSSEGITRTGGAVIKDVLSSARPAAPQVLYVIPAFEWSSVSSSSGVLESTRQGNRLRVYMKRPWFSSGAGELLGVVTLVGDYNDFTLTPPPAFLRRKLHLRGNIVPPSPNYDQVKPYITQWGNDPIWSENDQIGSMPTNANFPLATHTGTNLVLPELPGTPVNVAGHEVGFDTDRQLWFSDIEVSPGLAYTPFIRLALVRYQPKSLSGVEMSKVSLAEFVQLTPDRTASLFVYTPLGGPLNGLLTANVSATGVAPPTGTVMTIAVEKQMPDGEVATVGDDDLGWQEVPSQPPDPLLVQPLETRMTATRDNTTKLTTWTGEVDIATALPCRIVVREYEIFSKNPSSLTDPPATPAGRLIGRVVYATTFELT